MDFPLKEILPENFFYEENEVVLVYQVFQSRMKNSFTLENLRAILLEEVGTDLAEKVFELLFHHVKGEPVDLKAEFLVPDHDRKTTEDN